jgi:hypothetical protein
MPQPKFRSLTKPTADSITLAFEAALRERGGRPQRHGNSWHWVSEAETLDLGHVDLFNFCRDFCREQGASPTPALIKQVVELAMMSAYSKWQKGAAA